MAGRIDETNYDDVKERYLSSQSELSEFNGDEETFIAVVSKPFGGMDTYVDEVAYELGMPEKALYSFLERRDGYRSNSAVDDAHNKAYRELELDSVYRAYLEASEDASEKIDELVERVASGENITLVCYEESGDACHRHILVDLIRDRVSRRSQFTFV